MKLPIYEGNFSYVESLAKCSILEAGYNLKKPESVATGRVQGDIYLLVGGVIDLNKEVERLNKNFPVFKRRGKTERAS